MGVFSNNPDYWKGKPTGARTERNGDVVVSGFKDTDESLGRIMTNDPYMAATVKKLIRQALKEARKRLSSDVANNLLNDPRKAARAVKYGVYKSMFGGNLSILNKRKAGAESPYVRPRKGKVGQRGGNRIPRATDDRNRLDKYYGADRSFVLRFISSGTVERESRFGKRGNIRQRNLFGRLAPWQMEQAADEVAAHITEYIKQQTNGQK